VKTPSRTLTTAAVGFLLLDAVLFAFAAITFSRPWLFLPAAICLGAGTMVVLAWRRYRRTLLELEEARRDMRRQVEELRDLLHSKNLSN
jgi:hypothetical protein